MNKENLKKLAGGLSIMIVAVLAIAFFGAVKVNVNINLEKEVAMGLAAVEFQPFAHDVIGTKTGTTTEGVLISGTIGTSATTTYVSRISQGANQAVYTINASDSSSSAHSYFEVMGSNDDYCDTTNTSLSVDLPLVSDIRWFDAGNHLKGKVHETSFSNVSSTASFMWANPTNGAANEIVLVDLDYECLRLGVSGSSTVLHAQISAK